MPIVAMDRVTVDHNQPIVARVEELASQILLPLDIPGPHHSLPPPSPPPSFPLSTVRLKLS